MAGLAEYRSWRPTAFLLIFSMEWGGADHWVAAGKVRSSEVGDLHLPQALFHPSVYLTHFDFKEGGGVVYLSSLECLYFWFFPYSQ